MTKALQIIDELADKHDRSSTIYVQHLKNFGDVLHSSMVVRHLRKAHPDKPIVWCISERYADQFEPFSNKLNVKIVGMPHEGSPEDRARWARHAKTKFSRVVTPSVCPFGWTIAGDIVDNVLHNAGIKKLLVPRRPFFPHTNKDNEWAGSFLKGNGIQNEPFVALEYNSYTLSKPPHNSTWSTEKYNQMLAYIKYKVVFLGGEADPALKRGVDGRGTTWRQAKAIIARAKLFVGCGSGLSVMACCEDINTRMIEFNVGPSLRAEEIYSVRRSKAIKIANPKAAAKLINAEMAK